MIFRRPSVVLLFLLAIVILAAGSVQAQTGSGRIPGKPFIIRGVLVVEFAGTVTPTQLQQSFGLVRTGMPSVDQVCDLHKARSIEKAYEMRTHDKAQNETERRLANTYQLSLPEDADLAAARADLLADPNVREVEYVWAVPLERTPDDTNLDDQWHIEKIQAEAAWDLEAGSDSIVIAIIDSGMNYNHPDLKANVWHNDGEDLDNDHVIFDMDDVNGVSDDFNSYPDDFVGWDFFSGGFTVMAGEDGFTPDNDPNDFDGHGTSVAGVAAGVTNNGLTIAGLAGGWAGGHRSYRGCRIMCLRAGAQADDGFGYMNSLNVSQAIDYAVQNGADVINMSFGTAGVSQTSISNAIAAGLTLVHAAGNDTCDCPDFVDEDAGTVILSVAATDQLDRRTSFSNFGSWIDVSAPGLSIYTTNSTAYVAGDGFISGTSFSAPIVSGVAALVRSAAPNLDKFQIDSVVANASDNIDAQNPGFIGQLGTGRINVYKALAGVGNAQFSSDVTDGPVPLTIQFTDLSPHEPSSWNWTFGDGGGSVLQDPQYTYVNPGVYDVSLKVNDTNGLGEEHLRRYVWAQADTLEFESVVVSPGEEATVAVNYANTVQVDEIKLVFTLPNDVDVELAPATTVGTRAEFFHSLQYVGFDNNNKRWAILLRSSATGTSTYLPPGSGPVLYLKFDVPASVPDGTLLTLDTTYFSSHGNRFTTVLGEYVPPVVTQGTMLIGGCCEGTTGNADGSTDGFVDLGDVLYTANAVFLAGPPFPCKAEANTDGDPDCVIDLGDILWMAVAVFLGGPPNAPCDNVACAE